MQTKDTDNILKLQFKYNSHDKLENKHYADNRMHNVILSRGISYFLSVCGLCSNLVTMEVSCPMKKWARVKVKYKRLVISYRRPLSTIAIIARKTFLLFSVQTICSFPLHLPGHRPADCQHILCGIFL